MSYGFETQCVQGKQNKDGFFGAVSFPIFQTAAFTHPGLGESTGYDYSRVSNPTREELEKTVALLEQGTHALAFSTGMAAITALMELFVPGEHIIASDDLYGGTNRLFEKINRKNGLEISYVDTQNLEHLENSFLPKTKAIYLETPSNPTMKVGDIEAIAEIAHKHNCLLLVDNTFLTPYFQNPLKLGADIVIHSGTKYLGGHNDTLAGFLVTAREELYEQLSVIYKTTGAALGALDSWLILRGIKTLALRMEQHQKNALIIAEWLQKHPKIQQVYYLGLPSHPDYAITKKQCRGFGGMISFRVDSSKRARKLLEKVRLIRFAESLGGVESLMTYPIRQTHGEVAPEILAALGIDECLLRLSVGIENVEDLLKDLEQALGD